MQSKRREGPEPEAENASVGRRRAASVYRLGCLRGSIARLRRLEGLDHLSVGRRLVLLQTAFHEA